MSNDKGFTPNKSPRGGYNSFVKNSRGGGGTIDDNDQQLREVEDELEDEDMAFEVNDVATEPQHSTRTKPEYGRYSDANQ